MGYWDFVIVTFGLWVVIILSMIFAWKWLTSERDPCNVNKNGDSDGKQQN